MGWEEDQRRKVPDDPDACFRVGWKLASGWARTIRTHVLKSVGERVSQVGGVRPNRPWIIF